MKKLSLITALAIIPFFVFPQYVLKEGYISTNLFEKANDHYTYENLRIYPLTGGEYFVEAHADIGAYTNLEEALTEEKILITEKSSESNPALEISDDNMQPAGINDALEELHDYEQPANINLNQVQEQRQAGINDYGAEVNKLYVENISQDTIYLMAGEVVQGGKQDRVLAEDIILPPASGKVELPVFCVEPHRWNYESSDRSFNKYYTFTSNSIRGKAVKEKDQHMVWDAVEEITTSQGAESSTGAYTELQNVEEYNKTLEEYSTYFNGALASTKNCIGFVAVTGDMIIGCDIFATSDLFEKQRNNILNAYITEAITNGDKVAITDNEVLTYLEEFLSDESGQEEAIGEKGMQYKYRDKKIHVNTY